MRLRYIQMSFQTINFFEAQIKLKLHFNFSLMRCLLKLLFLFLFQLSGFSQDRMKQNNRNQERIQTGAFRFSGKEERRQESGVQSNPNRYGLNPVRNELAESSRQQTNRAALPKLSPGWQSDLLRQRHQQNNNLSGKVAANPGMLRASAKSSKARHLSSSKF